MSLIEKLQEEQKNAMKARDRDRLTVLRGLLAAVKNKQIDSDKELTEEEIQKVIASQGKQLKDALKDFETAEREDLIEKTKAEIEIIETFLPKQLEDQEIEVIAQDVISKVGKENFGLLMGAVMKEIAGRADGQRVRVVVQKLTA